MLVQHKLGRGIGIQVTPQGLTFVTGRDWSAIVWWDPDLVDVLDEEPNDELWAAFVKYRLEGGSYL